jgi:hypothetical protein
MPGIAVRIAFAGLSGRVGPIRGPMSCAADLTRSTLLV